MCGETRWHAHDLFVHLHFTDHTNRSPRKTANSAEEGPSFLCRNLATGTQRRAGRRKRGAAKYPWRLGRVMGIFHVVYLVARERRLRHSPAHRIRQSCDADPTADPHGPIQSRHDSPRLRTPGAFSRRQACSTQQRLPANCPSIARWNKFEVDARAR